jgi:membrane dipeptidase
MLNLGYCRLFAGSSRPYRTRTIDLVGRSVVIDMLGLLTVDWQKLKHWHLDPAAISDRDHALVKRSGIDIFNPAVDLNRRQSYAATRKWLTAWNHLIGGRSDWFTRIDNPAQIAATKASGKIGILLGMQNSEHFRTAGDVREFYELGQRISQLTYNSENRIGYGCIARHDKGLTGFGACVVQAMNTCGMAVDVSHAGERTTLDALEVSTRPVLITHSNCKALAAHPRCKSDRVIRAMAKKGGVMGITGLRPFVRQSEEATLEDALDHFDHVRRLVGVEHAGIGSDMDVEGRAGSIHSSALEIEGLNHSRRVFNITEGLLRRGYGDREIEMVLGGNFNRALSGILSKSFS